MPRPRDIAPLRQVDPVDLLTDDVAVELARVIARMAAREHHEAAEQRRREVQRCDG